MAPQLPIKFLELLQLSSIGVAQQSIGFNFTSLESDAFVCIRNKKDEASSPEVIIVDLKNNNNVIRRPIKADSAIMHWTRQIIALKAKSAQGGAGCTLQIFDLEAKQKLKSASMTEDVVFWKWISETSIGLVTDSSIYHWNVFDANQASPSKVFDRNTQLAQHQIINYRVSADGKWMVVVGITSRDNRVVGSLQLYSRDRGISQHIEGHAAAFGTLRLDGAPEDTKLFTFAVRSATGAKLHIVEVDHPESNPVYHKKAVDVFFPPGEPADFPVALQVSSKFGIIYLITKRGYIHLYDLESGTCIFMNRICDDTIFTTCADSDSTGVISINRKGQVLYVGADENTLVPYTLESHGNELALKLASRAGLPGADNLYQQRFEQLFNAGDYKEAANVAANSPRGFLRTPQTIQRFKSLPQQPGQMSPILQYFGLLLDKGTLNQHETIELAQPVLAQNRTQLLQKWLNENKLECSEQLGDMVRPYDKNMAVQIYLKANASQKVVAGFADLGLTDKILPYCLSVGYQPDWIPILNHLVTTSPEKGVEFATTLVNHEGGPLVDIERVVDVFQGKGLVQQVTAFLLEALKEDNPEQGHLQTRLLELNLMNAPQVAEAILSNNMFSHFDKARIADLCEQAGLYQKALELYTDPEKVKRVVINIAGTPKFNLDWLVEYFSTLSVPLSLECLDAMMKHNIRQNLQAVVQIAVKYSDILGPPQLIELFEKYKTAEGLFYYLGPIVNLSQDPEVNFKYIEAATKMGQFAEVERICRDSNYYNPEKVKNFLKEANLNEMLPLIVVCDRFNFVHDLVLYLYQKQQFKSIEVYVQRVNPARTPAVIGGLLDVDCDENVIKGLLATVNHQSVPIDELVAEVEKRNRLKLLLPFLEATLAAGNQQQAVYNALAKIYIDSNNNPEKFLKENDQYDTLVVGKYCEKRDPNLAYIAYRKGQNDLELINITNENSMYKAQARYLLDRADDQLWMFVLSENNLHRRSVIDQVISTAVPESIDPDKVAIAVKCFLAADLPGELIELLEKIVLEPTAFSDNHNLQNLLLFTAAKADKARVMDYIHRLDKYDADEIAAACIDVGLHEEALEIYKKVGNVEAATDVIVENIVSIDRAQAFAEQVDTPAVWSKVAKAQLDGLRVSDAIDSYIKANDPKNHEEVIEIAVRAGKDEELVKYLRMARKTLREPAIDTALAFCYARLDQLSELEDFLRGTNVANIEESGDKAYAEGLYEAAKIFYTSISNWAKLSTTLVHLEDYQAAVECARKANNIKVWKEVHEACVEKKEFRLATICGLHLIVDAEQLQALVKRYEASGYFDELIDLLEQGVGLERAHMGMFTELGIALSKYHPERLMEHLKIFWTRMNLPKMIRACEEANLWPELVFCYYHYDEFDNAVMTIINHPENSWEHNNFKEVIVKVANLEIYFKGINFYLEQHPSLLTDLLQVLTPRVDVNRVVRMFQRSDNLPLIKPFLLSVQPQNKRIVNDAINDLLIEEEDYKTLRDSVENHDNYDAVELASRLEKHDLVFFRQIAANIYRKNKRWEKSINLSKQDKLWKDAIETAAISAKGEVVEDLLRYFVDIGNRECYVGMLYACYELIRPDLVLELSWRNGLTDFAMPYMINMLSQTTKELALLKADNEARKSKEKEQEKVEDNTPILGGGRLMITAGPAVAGGAVSPGFPQTNGFAPQPTGFGF
jgi:clathrin heavy chain